jgi:hypothetical protein
MPTDQGIVKRIMQGLPEALHDRVIVRHSIIDQLGRCIFRMADARADDKIMVAVVTADDRPTGTYYVVPGTVCPDNLLVKPKATNSKWSAYQCSRANLYATIQATAEFMDRGRRGAVISRLG